MSDEFILAAYWKYRQRTMGQYITDLKGFLGELQRMDPSFSCLSYRSKSRPGFHTALLPDLSNLQQLILQGGDWEPRDYDHADSRGRPTLESNPKVPFSTSFWNGKAAIKGGLGLGVLAGSSLERFVSSVMVEFPNEEFDDDWLELGRLIPLFETVIKVWRPAYAIVTSHAFRYRVHVTKTEATVGWLTYFANAEAAKGLPGQVRCKTVETGGVILRITDDRLSAQNVDQVALARKVQETLRARRLLQMEHIYAYTRTRDSLSHKES
jgi:hypothetical protein